jgi:hypothetical protein
MKLFSQAWRWWHVSEANFNKIEFGMSLDEVEAILGRAYRPRSYHIMTPAEVPIHGFKLWTGPTDSEIRVGLDEDGCVVLKEFSSRSLLPYHVSAYRTKDGKIIRHGRGG